MPHGGSLSIVIERRRSDKNHTSTPLEPTGDHVMVAVRDSPTEKSAEIPERGDFRIVKGSGLSLAASYDTIKRCGGISESPAVSARLSSRSTCLRLASPRSFQAASAAPRGSLREMSNQLLERSIEVCGRCEADIENDFAAPGVLGSEEGSLPFRCGRAKDSL